MRSFGMLRPPDAVFSLSSRTSRTEFKWGDSWMLNRQRRVADEPEGCVAKGLKMKGYW